MKIERRFTRPGQDAYATIEFVNTTSEIRNPDGTVVFHLENVEVPSTWSQVASDIIAQKYFRKAGVPVDLKRVEEKGVPEFLWRSKPASSGTKTRGSASPAHPLPATPRGPELHPSAIGLPQSRQGSKAKFTEKSSFPQIFL